MFSAEKVVLGRTGVTTCTWNKKQVKRK